MSQHCFDASRSLTALEQDSTIIAVIEMSQTKWLVAALVPGVERQPLKKFDAGEEMLLKLLHRWRREAGQAGRNIKRIVVAYEAGRDGFWLARWLRARDVEAYVIHPTSIAVSREHRRAKTDRLDTELLMRVFLGWLRGEKRHCSMVAIPTIEEEDARRPNRERQNLVTEQTRIINQIKAIFTRFGMRTLRPTMRKLAEKLEHLRTAEGTPLPQNTVVELRRHLARLGFVRDQVRAVEQERLRKLAVGPAAENKSPDAMVRLIARVFGVGVETADMLVNEIFLRHWRNRKSRRPLRRPYRFARRERQPSTRTGSCARWQCPRPLRHDPAGLAFCQVPKEQCPGAMVRGANRRRTREHTQDDDCGTGA
jgi:transposase